MVKNGNMFGRKIVYKILGRKMVKITKNKRLGGKRTGKWNSGMSGSVEKEKTAETFLCCS
jgi:hypothetical protein